MMQKLKKWLRRLNEPAFDELPKASGGSAGSALVESKVVPPNPPPRQQSLQQLPRDTQQGQARADAAAQPREAAVVAPPLPPAAQPALPGHDRRSTSRSDSIPEVSTVCISRPFTRSAFFALQPYTLVSASGHSHSKGTSHAPPLVT